MRGGYVYILGSNGGTLYIGVTSDSDRRLSEHRSGVRSGFASKYKCNRLLYIEEFGDIRDAIKRETQLKGWTRERKLALIQTINPEFKDLAQQWGWLQIGPYRSIADVDKKVEAGSSLATGAVLAPSGFFALLRMTAFRS